MVKSLLKKVIPPWMIKIVRHPKLDPDYVLIKGPLTYNQDGLATIHNCDFMKDGRFMEAYNLGKQTGSWGKMDIHWRAYIACWAANKVKDLEGDFVECGVNKGGLALTLMQYINFKDMPKTFYLLDTFCGLSDKYITEGERKLGRKDGGYEECYEEVKETFMDFKNIKIIRGTVPDTLVQVKAKRIVYLSLDMNCVIPEISAAEFFWEKLVSGGIVLLDDYGWEGFSCQKRAFDDFAIRKKIQILQLPTGQGLIFKP